MVLPAGAVVVEELVVVATAGEAVVTAAAVGRMAAAVAEMATVAVATATAAEAMERVDGAEHLPVTRVAEAS